MAPSKMVSMLLFTLALLSSCGEAPDTAATNEQLVERELAPVDSIGIDSAASSGLTLCTLSVHSDQESFEISLYWVGPPDAAPGFRQAHTLTLKSTENGSVTVFDGLESNYYENSVLQGYLIAEDMNFDGYTDFRLMESPTAGPNTYWYFWLFDPDTGTFYRSGEYEESSLVSPEFDQDNRTIICFHRDGMGMYGTEYYGTDSLVITVTELVNDEMVITEQNVQEVN